jgi:hypothetical protein
MARGV